MQYINLTDIPKALFPQRERERESLPRGICEAKRSNYSTVERVVNTTGYLFFKASVSGRTQYIT